MPQSKSGTDFYRIDAQHATVTLKDGLSVNCIETASVKVPPRYKGERAVPIQHRRETFLLLHPNVYYHAILDEGEQKARLFVPYQGWFEEITIPLDLVDKREYRTEERIDYRAWGNAKQSKYTIKPSVGDTIEYSI